MFILNFSRWIKGYVKFEATGKFPERFLNLTLKESIQLVQPIGEKNKLTAQVAISDYFLLRKIAKKTGTRLRITQKRGLPIFINKNKKRSGLLVGLCLFIALTGFLSSFVWSVEVEGTSKVSEIAIKKILEEQGVTVGVSKSSIDVGKVVRETVLESDGISWMTLNLIGTSAKVSITENVDTPEMQISPEPCDIRATADGQIFRMDVSKGTALVTADDVVEKGQTLVSGIMVGRTGKVGVYQSRAKAYALVSSQQTIEVPTSYTMSLPDGGIVKRYRGELFGMNFPLSFKHVPSENSLRIRNYQSLIVNENAVPLTIQEETWYSCQKQLINLDENAANKQAETRLALYELFTMLDTEVLSRELNCSSEEDTYVMKVTYRCIKDIGEECELDYSYMPEETQEAE